MIGGRCPICSRSFEGSSLDEMPFFPFCSERCRMVDLNRWIEGEYSVSRPLLATDELDDDREESEPED